MVLDDNIQSTNRPDNTREEEPQIPQITKETEQNQQEDIKNHEIGILMSFNSWRDLLNNLNPRDYFLTKEDFEVIRSWITSKNANIEANIIEFLRTESNNPDNIRKLIQFIVIKKIGNILFQEYNVKLEALKFMLDKQTSLAVALVNAISSLAALIPQVAFNPIANAKWIGIEAILIGSYTATAIEIGNIKNNIRQFIQQNAFCIRLCNNESLNIIFKDIMDSNKMYNEGIQLAKDTNSIYNKLEELFNKEIDTFISDIKTNNNNASREDKGDNTAVQSSDKPTKPNNKEQRQRKSRRVKPDFEEDI